MTNTQETKQKEFEPGTKEYYQKHLKDVKVLYASSINGSETEFNVYFISLVNYPYPTLERITINVDYMPNGITKKRKDSPGTWGKSRSGKQEWSFKTYGGHFGIRNDLWNWLGFDLNTKPRMEVV